MNAELVSSRTTPLASYRPPRRMPCLLAFLPTPMTALLADASSDLLNPVRNIGLVAVGRLQLLILLSNVKLMRSLKTYDSECPANQNYTCEKPSSLQLTRLPSNEVRGYQSENWSLEHIHPVLSITENGEATALSPIALYDEC